MKRLIDIILAILLVIILIPFFLLIGLIIFFSIGKPIFFTQIRSGINGQNFTIYKFRSMINNYDDINPLSDQERITKFGKFLRRTSLDELPELINVILGDMSMVGPRPLLPEYELLYSDKQRIRNTVLPGITGLAQINGRNSITWEEKFNFDVWYVENRTIWLDLKILFLTAKKVFIQEGIYTNNNESMPPFEGSKEDEG